MTPVRTASPSTTVVWPDAHAGDVGDRVERARREDAGREAEVAGARPLRGAAAGRPLHRVSASARRRRTRAPLSERVESTRRQSRGHDCLPSSRARMAFTSTASSSSRFMTSWCLASCGRGFFATKVTPPLASRIALSTSLSEANPCRLAAASSSCDGDAFGAQAVVEHRPVAHQHVGVALDETLHPRMREHEADDHVVEDQQCRGADHAAEQRVVGADDGVLHGVRDREQDDQVEGVQLRQFPLAGQPQADDEEQVDQHRPHDLLEHADRRLRVGADVEEVGQEARVHGGSFREAVLPPSIRREADLLAGSHGSQIAGSRDPGSAHGDGPPRLQSKTWHTINSFSTATDIVVDGTPRRIYSLPALEQAGHPRVARLPFALKILLENLLRREDGASCAPTTSARWPTGIRRPAFARRSRSRRRACCCRTSPACRRSSTSRRCATRSSRLGGDPTRINPLQPVELVIDHSVQVDYFGAARRVRAQRRARVHAQPRALRVPALGPERVLATSASSRPTPASSTR